MNVVIWSKNRACQLDLLLRSIKKYWNRYDDNIFRIIYDYDNPSFKKGYDNTWKRYDWIKIINEINFKSDVRNRAIDDSEYTMFLCDDDIFTRPWKWNKGIMMSPQIACISLRLGQNITRHYIKGPSPAPEIKNGIWEWQGKNIDWGYPMSAGSGHIFRTADLMTIVEKGAYSNPTEFEDAMNAQKINRPKMFCYEHSIVFNIAINRVQDKRSTPCGEISAEGLNRKYLNDEYIDLEQFHYYENTSAHEIIKELKWSN